ncbi:MAG: hypothetical protein KDK40_01945, partial [Chlamydiia bacterium]|nr:hypothetical protein [Chlamydiia bacterium]
RALGRLAPEQLRQNLETLVNGEMKAAEFVFYQMHSVGALHLSSSEQSLLEETLSSSFHVILDYIFQILGAAGVLPNCEILFHCLRSKSPRVKSQVVETLEKTVPMPIFARIQPLIDSLPLDEKLIRCEELGICAASVEEILLYFAQSPILSNHIASAVLMQRLQMPGWREELRRQMLSKEELFHRFAYELLEQQ